MQRSPEKMMNSNSFEIPVAPQSRWSPTPSCDLAESANHSVNSTIRVLLVEDIPDNQINACKLLLRWGIIPVIAINGLMAVKIFKKKRFDIILMDISMPVMDGLEATLQIRREELSHPDHPRCPIVAYTSGGTPDHCGLWRKIGIDAVLNKPSQPEQMEACFRQWCGKSFDASTRVGTVLQQN